MKLFLSNYANLFKLINKSDKKYYLYVLIFSLFGGIFTYTSIIAPKLIINMITKNQIEFGLVRNLILILLISSVISTSMRYFFTPIGFRIRYLLLTKVLRINLKMEYENYENPEFLNKSWSIYYPVIGVDGVQTIYTGIALFSLDIVNLIIIFYLLKNIGIFIAAFVVIAIFAIQIYTSYTDIINERITNEYNNDFRKENYLNIISTDYEYAKEIRIFSLKNWITEKYNSVLSPLQNLYIKEANIATKVFLINSFFQFFRDFVIYATLIVLFVYKKISIGEFVSYSILASTLNNILLSLQQNSKQAFSHQHNVSILFNFLSKYDEDENITSENKNKLNVKDVINNQNTFEISINNLSFKYPGSDKFIYNNLNFKFIKGDKIAIVGLNGVGKSTLMKLLMKLYHPTNGEILLNDKNINSFKTEEYFKIFAPVFQDINIFAFSLKENLIFDADVSDESIYKYIKMLDLDKKISQNELYRNMTTYLDNDGIVLSGGESQKIAIARALCTKREILVLDEPTSALDAESEFNFFNNINNLYKDKTIIYVTHRLSSIKFVNRIIFIEDGKIIEDGSHDELIKKHGRYYELYNLQANKYEEVKNYAE